MGARSVLRGAPAAVLWMHFWSLLLVPGLAAADKFVAPYVPTVEEDVELMLEVAGVGPDDYLIDLGSGDGRIAIAAARRGALAHGVELDPDLVELARGNARVAGVAERVAFLHGDIFEAAIDRATVVTLYLFPEANLELRPKLLAELAAGTRVVSNSFHMAEWNPDVHDMSARSSGGILLWIVPAEVAGEWALEIDAGARFSFEAQQRFQEIELAFVGSGPSLEIGAAALTGDRIRFTAESIDTHYTFHGRVQGEGMRGYVQAVRGDTRAVARWQAKRAAD